MNNYLLGIEYSSERVKCALLKRVGKSYELYALQNFEGSNESTPIDSLIRWKTENLGAEPVKAVVALTESLIFFKELTVPKVSKNALDEAIYWELSENSPIPASEAIYEWNQVASSREETKVSAMAIRESVIIELNQRLEEAGIEVVAFEPSSVSLVRATSANYSKNTMLLMVSEHETDIVVIKSGIPVFSTTSDVTLQHSKGEKWKLEERVSHEIAEKTRNMLEFWEEKNNEKIEQVIITGDLVDKYFGLAQMINDFAKIPVNIARQKKITGMSLGTLAKAIVNRYFTSIGAVGRFMGDVYSDINLIPKDKKNLIANEISEKIKSERLSAFNRYLSISLFLLLLIGIGFFGYSFVTGRLITQTKNEVVNHEAQKLISEVQTTNNYLAKIQQLMNTQRDLGHNFTKLAELTPKEIRLTKISYANAKSQEWIVTGDGSRDAVLAYYRELKEKSGALSVTMPYSNINDTDRNAFEIIILW